MKRIMKKITLIFLLLTTLMSAAYAQRFGNNTSETAAIAAIPSSILGFGIGQFVNHNWVGGGVFLVIDIGLFAIMTLPMTSPSVFKSVDTDNYLDALFGTLFTGVCVFCIISVPLQLSLAVAHLATLSMSKKTAFYEDRQKLEQTYFASRTKRLSEFAQSFSIAGTKKGVGVFLTKTL